MDHATHNHHNFGSFVFVPLPFAELFKGLYPLCINRAEFNFLAGRIPATSLKQTARGYEAATKP